MLRHHPSPAEVAAVRGAGVDTGTTASTAVLPVATPPVSTGPNIILPKASPLTENDMPSHSASRPKPGSIPPIKESDLDHIEKAPQLAEIRAANANAAHLAPVAEVQPDDLHSQWGVVFSTATPGAQKQAIKDALKPLLDLRKSEAGDLFKVFDDQTGYMPGMPAEKWLTSRGSALNVVDPLKECHIICCLSDRHPTSRRVSIRSRYVLRGGSHRVGNLQEYAQYAQNIVNFEKAAGQQKTVAIFNTRNDGDRATALLHDQIAMKLALGGDNLKPLGAPQGYSMTTRLADTSDQSRAAKHPSRANGRGNSRDSLTGSHSVAFFLRRSSASDQAGRHPNAGLGWTWEFDRARHLPDRGRNSLRGIAE